MEYLSWMVGVGIIICDIWEVLELTNCYYEARSLPNTDYIIPPDIPNNSSTIDNKDLKNAK